MSYDDAFFETNKVLKIEENGVTIEFENPDFWKSILRSNTQDTLIDFLNPRFLEIIIHDFTLSAKDQFRELVFNTLDQIDKYLARRVPSECSDRRWQPAGRMDETKVPHIHGRSGRQQQRFCFQR